MMLSPIAAERSKPRALHANWSGGPGAATLCGPPAARPREDLFMKILQFVLCLLLAGVAGLHAEALVKPLPNPDLSKLTPDTAKRLREARTQFDKDKINLES